MKTELVNNIHIEEDLFRKLFYAESFLHSEILNVARLRGGGRRFARGSLRMFCNWLLVSSFMAAG